MKRIQGYLFILGATTCWGISATIAKFLFSQHVDTLVLVQMRMTMSCVLMLAIVFLFQRHLLNIKAKDIYRFALMGVIGGAGANFTYYYTIRETNVATAILLQYLAPLLVLLYAAISKEEKVTILKISAGMISVIGCFFAVGRKDFLLPSGRTLGIISGFGAAFCWAFANVWLRRLIHEYNVWTVLIYTFIFASLFWMLFNPPWDIVAAHYSEQTWMTFLGFAIISVLVPHSLYFLGMRYLTASQAIITATFEPIIAIISAYFILKEFLEPVQVVGAVLVIVAIVALQLREEQEKPVQTQGMSSGGSQ